MAISTNTVLVGARWDDIETMSGTNDSQGSAYVFVRNGTAWTQQDKLTASDGAANDYFGTSVALSGDTALVGASGTNTNQGSTYVFERSGTVWSQQAKLTANDGAYDNAFGNSVALSGDTALVGSPYDKIGTNIEQGSAYVFVRNGTTWPQQAKLTASDGGYFDNFGKSVALSGDTALVGAPGYDGTNYEEGSAYVFVKPVTGWADTADYEAKLAASDGATTDFGNSVALLGDTALVGANTTNFGQGSAYVFVRNGTVWTEQAKLTASDGAADDYFGWSVALSGTTALVAAPEDDIETNSNQGSAYVFVRTGTSWTALAKRTSNDGAAGANFGYSVAISGDTALVGAPIDDDNGIDSGAGYVFVRNGTTWLKQAKLTASDGAVGDQFGRSVALSGDMALVGAYVFVRDGTTWTEQAKLAANDGAGGGFGNSVSLSGDTALVGADGKRSAYVFVRDGTTWIQQAKLTASDGAAFDYFGYSVALSGDTALVGAFEDIVPMNGSAYVFVRNGTTWTQQAKLTASDGAAYGCFGWSVALSGDTALVGAPNVYAPSFYEEGSAYVFVRNGTMWTQQAKLTASDGAFFYVFVFGTSVALSGDTALVGASHLHSSTTTNQNSAYVFVKPPAGWTTTETYDAKLTANNGEASSYPGLSVALSEDGSFGLVGAPNSDDPEPDAGAVYLFSLIRSLGLSCGGAAACETGFCVDGVCCNTPCSGPCQSCAAATNAFGTNGFCGPAIEGLDPHNSCDDSRETDPSSCGTTGVCSAFGSCAVYAYGESCGDPQCTDSNVAQENFCNGVGACVAVTHDCKTYACDAGVCKSGECTTDTDCATDAYCNKNLSPSECAVKKNIGETCSPETNECKSGFCVDGVCCDSPCLGTCQACSNALKGGSEPDGYCGPAKQGTLDANCNADASKPCGYDGTCNEFGACTLPASGSKSQEKTLCVGGFYYTRQFCNGLGSFVPDPSSAEFCDNAFQCNKDTGACKTECTNTASDCVTGFQCAQSTKECIPIGQCRTVGDCADDEVCDETFRCVKRNATITPDVYDDACACSLPGQSSTNNPAKPLLALGIVALWLRSRKRSIPNDATMI